MKSSSYLSSICLLLALTGLASCTSPSVSGLDRFLGIKLLFKKLKCFIPVLLTILFLQFKLLSQPYNCNVDCDGHNNCNFNSFNINQLRIGCCRCNSMSTSSCCHGRTNGYSTSRSTTVRPFSYSLSFNKLFFQFLTNVSL